MTTQVELSSLQEDLLCQSLDICATQYLRYLGVPLAIDDLWIGLPHNDEGMTPALLGRALQRVGYALVIGNECAIENLPVPCVIALGENNFALVLRVGTESVTVIDAANQGVLHEIPISILTLTFSGKVYEFLPRLDALEKKYIDLPQEAHWFWSKVLRPRSKLLEVTAASFTANLIAVAVSLFALQVYDRVIPNQSEATLWALSIGAFIAIAFEFFLKVARSQLIDDTGKDSEILISRDLFQKMLGMRIDKRPLGSGAMVSMMREFQGVREFFGTATVGVVADLPFTLVFLLLIYTIAGPVVWVIIAGAVLMVLPSLIFQKKMMRLSKEMLGGLSAASRLATEVSYGLESVKSARSEPWFTHSWEEMTQLNAVKSSEQRALTARLTFWSASVQQATYIGAIIGGVYLLFAGEFTTGSIIAISILSSRTLGPITQLANVLSRWQNMKTSLAALDMIMTAPQDYDTQRSYIRKARFRGEITLEDAAYVYGSGKKPNVFVKKLHILPGQKLALLGQNGSGKSTLLRLMSSLYSLTSGSYLIDGLDVEQIDPMDVRRNVGYLPQETHLFRGRLRDNLRVSSLDLSDEALMEALDFSGLAGFVRTHPEGLDLPIGDGGVGLSTGQKVAVGLARLYLQDPSIVLMDEPTAALDQQAEVAFTRKLEKWLGDRTCIVATHRTAILSQMDQVGLLKDGVLIVVGPRDAVLERLKANT